MQRERERREGQDQPADSQTQTQIGQIQTERKTHRRTKHKRDKAEHRLETRNTHQPANYAIAWEINGDLHKKKNVSSCRRCPALCKMSLSIQNITVRTPARTSTVSAYNPPRPHIYIYSARAFRQKNPYHLCAQKWQHPPNVPFHCKR